MKQFNIPSQYRSNIISKLKAQRKLSDPRKRDFSPAVLDFGPVRIHLARHFGFCYGVENAIEIAYSAIEENPNKKIYMLSQMIHNPTVNSDLNDRGLSFILDTEGNQITPWEHVSSDNIVIIPAFGTTLEIEAFLQEKGIETKKYNTTCPFVEKVWNMAGKLGQGDYSVIIHGKFKHEETQATFSHSKQESASVVVKDIDEARFIGDVILGERSAEEFYQKFEGKYSTGFTVENDLKSVGVINQTTMLASDTHEIAEYFKATMAKKYGEANLKNHFADTRDTLCYATNDNQQSTMKLLELEADLAIIVGGYNSSNTSHIVDLCATKFPSFFINGSSEIEDDQSIHHFDYSGKKMLKTESFLPKKDVVDIVVTSGASCPDAVVEKVIERVLSFYQNTYTAEEALKSANI
jgi:4-hydroxy-3-methylbut-2-enyl diphosphate reductase